MSPGEPFCKSTRVGLCLWQQNRAFNDRSTEVVQRSQTACVFHAVTMHCRCCWSGRHIVSVESIGHPLRRLWQDQDGAETTVLTGDWTTTVTAADGGQLLRVAREQRCNVQVIRYTYMYSIALSISELYGLS